MSAAQTFPWKIPTLLAPMEGVTHPLYRELLASRGGIGMLCTEFVRVSRAPVAEKTMRRAVIKYADIPLSVQVMGNDADKMAEAAALVEDAGADVVDINLGCPMPRVVKKGVGAAMLKDPVLLSRVLKSMRASTKGLLSAKIRAGFDDADRVVSIGKTVEDSGVDFIAVHPRTRRDFYQGVADWRTIRLLQNELAIPVIGNGDIWYAADAIRMMEETGAVAAMIGRPALRNPWIFQQVEALLVGNAPIEPNGDDVVSWFVSLRDHFSTQYESSLGKLKEHCKWLSRSLVDGVEFRGQALRSQTSDELIEHMVRRFSGVDPQDLDLRASSEIPLEQSGRVE